MSMQELKEDLEALAGTVKGCLEHHGAAHWCVALVVINPNEDDDSIVLVEPGHEVQIKRVVARVQDHMERPVRATPAPPMNDVKLRVLDGGKKDDSDK